MKVVLLQDVPKVGRKFEVKEVKSGYGRNFLLKNRLAAFATPQTIQEAEKKHALHQKELAERIERAEKELSKINGKEITITAETNEHGGLFAQIGDEQIENALRDQTGVSIPKECIEITSPIKKTGEYTIGLSINKKTGSFTLKVEQKK